MDRSWPARLTRGSRPPAHVIAVLLAGVHRRRPRRRGAPRRTCCPACRATRSPCASRLRGAPAADDVVVVGDRRRHVLRARPAVAVPALAARAARSTACARRARETIVYDVQFTEPTEADEDLALYDAVARAGNVVLATSETDGAGPHERPRRRREPAPRPAPRPRRATSRRGRAASSERFTYARRSARRRSPSSRPRALGGAGPEVADFARRRRLDRLPRRPGHDPAPSRSPTSLRRPRARARPARQDRRRRRLGAVAAGRPRHARRPATQLMAGAEIQANAIWTALHGSRCAPRRGWLDILADRRCSALAPALAGPARASAGGRARRAAARRPPLRSPPRSWPSAPASCVDRRLPLVALVMATTARRSPGATSPSSASGAA